MRMESLQAGQLWRLTLIVWLMGMGRGTTTVRADLCDMTHDGHGKPDTLCASPYCSCNNPYGRVYCSCIPKNATLPQAFDLTVKSSGQCRVPSEAKDIVITECRNVTFPTNGLQKLQNLRTIQVSNTRETIIARHAFHWNTSISGGLVIMLTNTTVADLPSYTFSGQISRIIFRNVYIGLIRSFAFSSIIDTDRIHFDNCNFANIEPQSFKKFTTNEFHMENNRFHIIPSRFLIEIHVHNTFRMNSNFIDIARTLSFEVHHAKETILSNNKINLIEGEAFSMMVHGRVRIQDNIFENLAAGVFRGIKMDPRKMSLTLHELKFENNTIDEFSEASLFFNTDQFHVHLSKILIDKICTCDNLIKWRDTCFPPKKTKVPIEAHLSEIWCHEDSKKEIDLQFISGEVYYDNHCAQLISSIYFFVIVIVCTIVGLCVLIVVCFILLKRRRKWDMVPTTDIDGVKQKVPKTKKGLVVPDGRVYRETEFHVIVEKAEPLEEAVPFQMTRDRSRTICNGENII